MANTVDKSLQKITKGAGVILLGNVLGMLLAFFWRVLLIRYLTQSEYGIFSLGLVIFNIFAVISLLGLHQGTPRYLAYYRGIKDEGSAKNIIFSSIIVALISSLLLSFWLFLASDLISSEFFREPDLFVPLKLFTLAIPFLALINVLSYIFQGFEKTAPRAYFVNLLRHSLFFVLLTVIIFLGSPFITTVYAFVASIFLTFFIFLAYTLKKNPLSDFPVVNGSNCLNSGLEIAKKLKFDKDLLLFSLPLLGTSILWQLITWTDTLMLGYFLPSEMVGLYNGAVPLARILIFILVGLNYLYLPIMTQLYAKGHMDEIKRIYQVLTKWILLISFPLFLLFLLFPNTVLSYLFGSEYFRAAIVLQVLTIGYFVHVLFGLNTNTFVVLGKAKVIMWATLITVVFNLGLNSVLIPTLGIVGAAIATSSAFIIENIIIAICLYAFSKIQPFTKNMIKPVITSLFPIFFIYTLFENYFTISSIFVLLLILFIFFIVFFLAILVTKSYDKEDIKIILAIEKKLGLNLRR